MMKRKMPLVTVVAVFLSSASMAGLTLVNNVAIDLNLREASGSVVTARNSTDTAQYIGCGTKLTGGVYSGFCKAGNTVGTWVTCTTTNPQAIAVMQSVTESSYINFKWNSNGECVDVIVHNSSLFAPKQP